MNCSHTGSKVTESALLECLLRLNDPEIKAVGMALGISNARLEGMTEGQRLAQEVARTYQELGDGCKELSWSDLVTALVEAGQNELAQRITTDMSKCEFEKKILNYPVNCVDVEKTSR